MRGFNAGTQYLFQRRRRLVRRVAIARLATGPAAGERPAELRFKPGDEGVAADRPAGALAGARPGASWIP